MFKGFEQIYELST